MVINKLIIVIIALCAALAAKDFWSGYTEATVTNLQGLPGAF